MATRKSQKPRPRAHAPGTVGGDEVTSTSELLAATIDPDCEPEDLRRELESTREELTLLRERLEARICELEAALAEAGRARCPVCGDRVLRPADETESI